MRIFYSDVFVLPLPEGHRFPMAKYRLLREAVQSHPELRSAELLVPEAATDGELLRVHDAGYLDRVCRGTLDHAEVRRIGFPWSPELVERSRRSVGGTIGAARAALEEGASANLAGGTHHAFADRGEGFCVFNDVAVAIEAVRAEGGVGRVGVLDLDVHQGNGTAALYKNDNSVYTSSVHGAANFPFRKETSDWDRSLPDGCEDEPFLDAVREAVRRVREDGRPDLVFYVAGADAYRDDRLGRLNVSARAMTDRDEIVVEGLLERGIPVVAVMAGGYARAVGDTVAIHLHSVLALARARSASTDGRAPRSASPGRGRVR